MAATSARVALPWGSRLPLARPDRMPFYTAQAMAFWAQAEMRVLSG